MSGKIVAVSGTTSTAAMISCCAHYLTNILPVVGAGLKEIGVGGCTVYPVRGYGEEWHVYEPLVHGGHHKIEVIIEDDLAERVVTEIIEKGWTGLKGDGVLAVFDLDQVVHLRSKSLLT